MRHLIAVSCLLLLALKVQAGPPQAPTPPQAPPAAQACPAGCNCGCAEGLPCQCELKARRAAVIARSKARKIKRPSPRLISRPMMLPMQAFQRSFGGGGGGGGC